MEIFCIYLQVNSFQVVISQGDNATFLTYLFEEIECDTAVSGFSSGTEFFELPFQLLTNRSNIGEKGKWMFRVDDKSPVRCPAGTLEPPLCQKGCSSYDSSLIWWFEMTHACIFREKKGYLPLWFLLNSNSPLNSISLKLNNETKKTHLWWGIPEIKRRRNERGDGNAVLFVTSDRILLIWLDSNDRIRLKTFLMGPRECKFEEINFRMFGRTVGFRLWEFMSLS